MAFVGSENDITDSRIADEICHILTKENIFLDLILIGPDVRNAGLLKSLIPEQMVSKCNFLDVPSSATVLSDNFLASPIGPGTQPIKTSLSELAKNDPDLAAALSLSVQPTHVGPRSHPGSSIAMMLQEGDSRTKAPKSGKVARVRRPRASGKSSGDSEDKEKKSGNANHPRKG
jgi:hypothetical protein